MLLHHSIQCQLNWLECVEGDQVEDLMLIQQVLFPHRTDSMRLSLERSAEVLCAIATHVHRNPCEWLGERSWMICIRHENTHAILQTVTSNTAAVLMQHSCVQVKHRDVTQLCE